MKERVEHIGDSVEKVVDIDDLRLPKIIAIFAKMIGNGLSVRQKGRNSQHPFRPGVAHEAG